MKRTERLIDVLRQDVAVLHTFPVTVEAEDGEAEAVAKEKALQAAAYARLVPPDQFRSVTVRSHTARGGHLAPYGDSRPILTETKEMLEQEIRELAYRLWEQDGRQDGRADEYWFRARHSHLCERAYALWEMEGCPDGRTDEHWFRTEKFEEC